MASLNDTTEVQKHINFMKVSNQMSQPNFAIYVEQLNLTGNGKTSSTVAIFKAPESKDTCYFGVWLLDAAVTLSGKREHLYFALHQNDDRCQIILIDDSKMLQNHINFLRRITDDRSKHYETDPIITPIIASAFHTIASKRHDVRCNFLCPSDDFAPVIMKLNNAVSAQCESISFQTFSKTRKFIESANVNFMTKRDDDKTVFNFIKEMFFN